MLPFLFDPKPETVALRQITQRLDTALHAADLSLKADLKAREEEKKRPDPWDKMEEKVMTNIAVAAAASGTPEQAHEILQKARAKALRAAADGADTAALEAMVTAMQHLVRIAEDNQQAKARGARHPDPTAPSSADALPFLAATAIG